MEPEQNGENHTSEISHSAYRATHDAVGMRVDVRDQREGSAVAGLEEERHAGDEAEHGGLAMRVEQADGDQEGAGDDADGDDPGFLEPEVGGHMLVEEVADDAAEGSGKRGSVRCGDFGLKMNGCLPGDDVKKTEHAGPSSGACLSEVGEVLEVVGRDVAVDGEFTSDGSADSPRCR